MCAIGISGGAAGYFLANYYFVYVKGSEFIKAGLPALDTAVQNQKVLLSLGKKIENF